MGPQQACSQKLQNYRGKEEGPERRQQAQIQFPVIFVGPGAGP